MSDVERDLDGLINDLRVFIELSFQDGEIILRDWIDEIFSNIEGNCWIKQKCNKTDCPAYENFECGRCWLIAGTMCGKKPTGKFVEKYSSCLECEVFQDVVRDDKVKEMKEFVIILVNSLRLKQTALKKARAEIKILSGFLPICASCKKIRDDEGNWKQIESYIKEHSEAEFSHTICPDCYEKFYSKYSKKKK